jgi:hypothetical protein
LLRIARWFQKSPLFSAKQEQISLNAGSSVQILQLARESLLFEICSLQQKTNFASDASLRASDAELRYHETPLPGTQVVCILVCHAREWIPRARLDLLRKPASLQAA